MASLTSTTTEQELIAPESDEHDALEALSKLIGRISDTPLRLIADDGSELEVPTSLRQVLQRAIIALANQQTVSIEPLDRFVSIAEAARLLSVPPEAVMAVIERQEITSTIIDGRQMLEIRDVIAWGARHRALMRKGLDELTQLSQELGLYDLDRQG